MYNGIRLLRSWEGGYKQKFQNTHGGGRFFNRSLLNYVNCDDTDNIGKSDNFIYPNGKVKAKNIPVVKHFFND